MKNPILLLKLPKHYTMFFKIHLSNWRCDILRYNVAIL